MRFDRRAPGSGVRAVYRPENGRAFLQWEFFFTGEPGETAAVRVLVTGREGETVLEGVHPVKEEEPLCSVLLQPRLWKGTKEPYLYGVEAILTDHGGRCLDRVRSQLPLRSLKLRKESPGDGSVEEKLFLNGEAYEPKAVAYRLPDTGEEAADRRLIRDELQLLSDTGADCVCMESAEGREELRRLFLRLCDQAGFLVFERGGTGVSRERDKVEGEYVRSGDGDGVEGETVRPGDGDGAEGGYVWTGDGNESEAVRMPRREEIPAFCGEKGAFFLPGRRIPTPLFHLYRAKWSRQPFVHIVPESIKRSDGGNYTVCCYSNCDRLALYSDGALFEFKSGETEFVFREVPAKSPCIMLTAEGDGCREALSVHKSLIQSKYSDS